MHLRIIIVTAVLYLGMASGVGAQDLLPARQASVRVASLPVAPTENEIRAKRREISVQLGAASKELVRIQEVNPENAGKTPVAHQVDRLKQLDAILAQQQTAQAKKDQLTQRIAELESEIQQIRTGDLEESDTGSFIAFDQLRNELESSEARVEKVEAAVQSAAEALETAKQAKESQDAALRLAKEQLASNRQDEESPELESIVAATQLDSQLADETLVLCRLNNEIAQLENKVVLLSVQRLQEKTDRLAGNVQFSDADLQEILIRIERQELELRESANLVEERLKYAQREWSQTRDKVDSGKDTPLAREELTARRVARQLYQYQFDVINLRLGRLANSREVWNRRARVFNGDATNEELSLWSDEAKKRIAVLERERRIQALESDDTRKEIVAIDTRLQSLADDAAELKPWIVSQLEDYRESLATIDQNLASIDAALQLHGDLLAEITGDIEHWTFGEHVQNGWRGLVSIWNTELASIDERPITVGKVVVGILLLFVGLFAARFISWILGNRMLTRLGLNEGAVAALKSLTFYSLVVVFSLLALRFANVPLTIFTLLGGALAIGIGFGSQAIINNFISGLILLAERPIQVGDLVKIDDLIGTVTHIGARSTRIRTGDNLDIIVPNSKFLETNVHNFTLGDDKFRAHIRVGIAYGSPTRDATRMLIRAAEEHGQILANPKPFVWFRDFGDNSLILELHVWIKVRTLGERLRIESDLRYRIDQLFREAGIVIAFPQRDLHLDFRQPLEIRMTPPENLPVTDVNDLRNVA